MSNQNPLSLLEMFEKEHVYSSNFASSITRRICTHGLLFVDVDQVNWISYPVRFLDIKQQFQVLSFRCSSWFDFMMSLSRPSVPGAHTPVFMA